VSKALAVCTGWWCCCPSFVRWFLLFFVANIVGDLVAFPFVHSFWNLVHFEGWFNNE
jgi:hypothetical protein